MVAIRHSITYHSHQKALLPGRRCRYSLPHNGRHEFRFLRIKRLCTKRRDSGLQIEPPLEPLTKSCLSLPTFISSTNCFQASTASSKYTNNNSNSNICNIKNSNNMAALEDSDFEMHVDEDSDFEFMSDGEENVVPPSKKVSTKPGPKATKGKKKPNPILSPRSSSANNVAAASAKEGEEDGFPTKGKKKKKTIEERYQKKTQHEHILIRPDTYIGSVVPMQEEMFVYDGKQDAIVKKEITYTPGLYKIFDESKWTMTAI